MEDLTLTPEEKKYLELARSNHKDSLFCQGCGTCLTQCPIAPDIPTLMRSYMYAYGYRDLSKAKETLNEADLTRMGCFDCTGCSVNCTMGFNVREKVQDITRLKDVPGEFLV